MSTDLYLKRKSERRLHGGHLWVFSNEVDSNKSALSSFAPGQEVVIRDYQGTPLGKGYINPHSLICARLLSYDTNLQFDSQFFIDKITCALSLRESLFDKPYYRLIHSEGDYLPGLIVDRFNDTLVVQVNTAGIEQKLPIILEALTQVIQPNAILLRNDSPMRQLENLPLYVKEVVGEVADKIVIVENQVQFNSSIKEGQKTGWFYDHRYNRAKLKAYIVNKRVLDVFSYLGSWGIQAAISGAQEVHCLDSSKPAIKQLIENTVLNKVAGKITTHCVDAFSGLNEMLKKGDQYDVIVLDPPAFIKRKKDIKEGQLAYRRINELAIKLLATNGILFTASCSMHLAQTELVDILRRCARKLNRSIQIIEQGHQAPDHPIHPAIPETEYLKLIVARII